MMLVPATVGFLWPFADTSVVEAVVLVVYVALLLAVVPVGWVLIKRRFGLRIAGPLWPLAFFLVLASLYAMATPPWQTPDEPQHMLYSELVRRADLSLVSRFSAGEAPPNPGVTQDELAVVFDTYSSVVNSLREVDLWPADAQRLIDRGQIPGVSELSHPPLYYVVSALLTEPLGSAPLLARLAVLRAFGIMVAGWVVWLCGVAGRLLWPTRLRLAETPMVVAAAFPSFASFAGTVNNDVLAKLWGAALLVVALLLLLPPRSRRGWIWVPVALALMWLGIVSKSTVVPVIPVAVFALVARRNWNPRRLLTALVVVQLTAGIVLLSLPTRTAVWEGQALADVSCGGGRIGDASLCGVQRGVTQHLPVKTIEELSGRAVSVGFWARASAPTEVTVFIGSTPTEGVSLPDDKWHFGRVRFVVPPDLRSLPIVLRSARTARVDGVVLVPGRFSERRPVYLREDGSELRWDGRRIENRLANGSAEDDVVDAPTWLPGDVRRTVRGVVEAVYALGRGQRVSGEWDFLGERLGLTFGIFWGTMGWDQPPPVLPAALLWAIGVAVVAGLVGASRAFAPPWRLWRTRQGVVMLAGFTAMVLAVVIRGIPATDVELISGRYLFPGILAFAVVLAAGWRRLAPGDDKHFRTMTRWFAVGTHAAFIITVFIPFRWG